jgi:hypothetical protein
VSEGWQCQLNEKTRIQIEKREQLLFVHQTGAPESVEEAKSLIAIVTEAVRDSNIADIVLDNRQTDAPREPMLGMLRAFFTKDGPLRDVALVLHSAPHRMRFNAVATVNSSINVRAFPSIDEASHWLIGWREWEEHTVCLFRVEDCLYGSLAADIAEVIAYLEPTKIPGSQADMQGVVAIDSTVFRVLATPVASQEEAQAPTRLLLGSTFKLALAAHETPFVGTLRICDTLEHGTEVRSSSGNFVWIDFATLAKLAQGETMPSI